MDPLDFQKFIVLKSQVEETSKECFKCPQTPHSLRTAFVPVYIGYRSEVIKILTDSNYLASFEKTVPTNPSGYGEVAPAFTAMLGFMKGVIEGETYKMQLEKNAEAYARIKLESEKSIGFGDTK